MRQVQPEFSEENLGVMRYVDHQELRYSLRSVEAYAPWVNHIYVITDEQKPSWMKSHPKITIIDHSEIVPSIYRPLFSSIAIEHFYIVMMMCFLIEMLKKEIFLMRLGVPLFG